jgi:hypothetical protein
VRLPQTPPAGHTTNGGDGHPSRGTLCRSRTTGYQFYGIADPTARCCFLLGLHCPRISSATHPLTHPTDVSTTLGVFLWFLHDLPTYLPTYLPTVGAAWKRYGRARPPFLPHTLTTHEPTHHSPVIRSPATKQKPNALTRVIQVRFARLHSHSLLTSFPSPSYTVSDTLTHTHTRR